ncbi:Alkaline phosphatase 3 precursor [Anaerohalosphaera lusitana]|uniref:Alkaline phosphatase 3 n=1 Tax=Anaerohalosphaera lusitana TaxID=1936003 RepID=A0A1U9NHZ1_9BACT|nr:alkaline phosphatase [Anaerohalosphaera lusitana]AQT67435.1 Alkaline phosphatase 3 precursor [Anaerohalosphaera lusitana]
MYLRGVKKLSVVFACVGVVFFAAGVCPAEEAGRAASPKNIIIMIADGCGFNHVDTASYYQYGHKGRQVYEQFPFKIAMSTYAAGQTYEPEQAWKYFNYVEGGGYARCTDSAAAATAMSTGTKTYKGAIGVDLDRFDLANILEAAEKSGRATGVVTSVQFAHATPAGFSAHNVARGNYAEIAREMIYESGLEVIMGCGHPLYDENAKSVEEPKDFKFVGGADAWADISDGEVEGADADGDGKRDSWTFVDTGDGFEKIGEGDTPKRVLGIPRVRSTLQYNRAGGREQEEPYAVERNKGVPALATMVRAAINVLDEDEDGLCMMIEGGAVDWAGHGNNLPRMIEEQIEFNRAVETVVDWVEENSNWQETMLVVTADHETGYLTGPGSGANEDGPVWKEIVNNGKGKMPGGEWHSGGHTNSLVPFYVKGRAGREFVMRADGFDPVRGHYIDNTDIADYVFELLSE